MAFPTQETRDQTRLARVASEAFELIDDVFVKTNQHKKNPNYQRQTYPAVKSPSQTSLLNISEDGFKVIDKFYNRKMVNPSLQTSYKCHPQEAFAQYGRQPVTVEEGAATSDDPAKKCRGYVINEYGNGVDGRRHYIGSGYPWSM